MRLGDMRRVPFDVDSSQQIRCDSQRGQPRLKSRPHCTLLARFCELLWQRHRAANPLNDGPLPPEFPSDICPRRTTDVADLRIANHGLDMQRCIGLQALWSA